MHNLNEKYLCLKNYQYFYTVKVFVVIHFKVMEAERDNNTATYLIDMIIRYEDSLLSLSAAIT